MYEPKIRCAEAYRNYVNQLHGVTMLDRNQIMRLMMFSAPFSGLFQSEISKQLKAAETMPTPLWTPKSDLLWLTQGGEGYELQNSGDTVIRVGSVRIAI